MSIELSGQPAVHLTFDDFPDEAEYLPEWDGLNTEWETGFGEGRVFIDADAPSSPGQGGDGNALRVEYPAGGVGPGQTGAQMPVELPFAYEYYLRYDVYFAEEFSWGGQRVGGKLPGLASRGLCSGGKDCNGRNGFTARYMWNDSPNGDATLYLYHMDKDRIYGDHRSLGFVFEAGRWHTLIQRVRINDSFGGKVEANGEVETWIDGTHHQHLTGLRFVSDGSFLNRFYFSTFVGGGTADYALPEDGIIWFDNIVISKDRSDVFGKPALNLINVQLPSAVLQQNYKTQIRSTGGELPYNFRLSEGELPEGISLDAQHGILSGRVTGRLGNHPIRIEVMDAAGSSVTGAYVIQVIAPQDFSITSTNLPDGAIGAAYAHMLEAEPDDGVSWRLKPDPNGQLPHGLGLTGDGQLTGIPQQSGSYTFAVEATRDQVTSSVLLNMEIHPFLISDNLLENGSFSSGLEPWVLTVRNGADASLEWDSGAPFAGWGFPPQALITIPNAAQSDSLIQFYHPLPLESDTLYELSLTLHKAVPDLIKITLQETVSPYENHETHSLTGAGGTRTSFGPYWFYSEVNDPTAVFRFLLGRANGEVAISNVSVRKWFGAPGVIAGPLSEIPEVASGWRYSPQMGWFVPFYPWVYFAELGWIYWNPDTTGQYVHAYFGEKTGWVSLHAETYPLIYHWRSREWRFL